MRGSPYFLFISYFWSRYPGKSIIKTGQYVLCRFQFTLLIHKEFCKVKPEGFKRIAEIKKRFGKTGHYEKDKHPYSVGYLHF